MAHLYADEQFPRQIVQNLRSLGHDVQTVQEAGNAGLKIPDDRVLEFATSDSRSVLTLNRQDFIRLHRIQPNHSGIITCTNDRNWERLASRIDEAIFAEETLTGKLIRVIRPQS